MGNVDLENIAQIAKFEGKNYQQWKFQVKCALRAKGLYGIADGSTPKPEVFTEGELWNKKDAQAMCIITAAMGLNQISLIENCETSKQVLDKLNSIYDVKTETNKMLVHEQFYQYKLLPTDSMAQHISKVENLAMQIKNSGDQLSDTAVITKIMSTLPPKYGPFRQAWLSMDEARQTIENLTSRLLDEERNLSTSEHNEDYALAATQMNKFGNRNFRNTGPPQRKPSTNVKCYNRGKRGHFAKDCRCPKRQQLGGNTHRSSSGGQNDNERERGTVFPGSGYSGHESGRARHQSGSGNSGNTANGRAFNIEDSDDSVPEVDIDCSDIWILDSGASRHMCHSESMFTSVRKVQNLFVKLGDNKELPVQGIGEILIEKFVNGTWCKGVMTDVWLVPGLRRNLFSEGAVTNKGFTIFKDNQKAEIFESGQVVATAVPYENNLYRVLIRLQNKNAITEVNVVSTGTLKQWHERLGHLNIKYIKELFTKNLVSGISITDINDNFFCESCVYAKQHKLKFQNTEKHVSKPGELISSDVCGPMSEDSIGGSKYYVLFKDNYTGYRSVNFIRHKSDVTQCFKNFISLCNTKFGHKVQRVRVDNGREYVNESLKQYLSESGIVLETTGIYTPEQNGRCERDNRTIMESARALLFDKDLPKTLWAEAVNTSVYLLNRTPTKQSETTPYEHWTGKRPNLQHTKVFGCEAYLLTPGTLRTKLDKKSERYVFVGYEGDSTNYRLYDPVTHRIKVSRHVIFNEDSEFKTPRQNCVLLPIENNRSDNLDAQDDLDPNYFEEPDIQGQNDTDNEQVSRYNLRVRKDIHPPEYLCQNFDLDFSEINFTEISVPSSYQEAISCPNKQEWKAAIQEELQALEVNKTWELVDLPPNRSTIGTKWVFRVKEAENGHKPRFKARLCAKGFSQVKGVDFQETFSPTTRYDTLRVLLALSAQQKMKMRQFDIKTAFLYGVLSEELYIDLPEGLNNNKQKVCKLNKALYGLKQAPRVWNETFKEFCQSIGFYQCTSDNCVYIKTDRKVFLALYVDDGLLLSDSDEELDLVLVQLQKRFQITIIEDPKYFVGLQIERLKDDSIFIHQSKYIHQIVHKFGQEDSNPVSVPADPNSSLSKDLGKPIENIPYREAVGSLMFLAIVSRPDIMYSIGLVSRYLQNPTTAHWNAVKRIFKYLKGTLNIGIHYKRDPCGINLSGYCDSDFAGDIDTRRSTTGYVFLINNSAVTWKSQKQKCVSLSTTEAEYVAASTASREAIWLKNLLEALGENIILPVNMYVDNQSALKLIKNPVFHPRTKHIDIKFHFVRDQYVLGLINFQYVSTNDQTADGFTKALSVIKFKRFVSQLGIKCFLDLLKIK